MNPHANELPDNILRCMSTEVRKSLGLVTIQEAQQSHDCERESILQAMCEAELSRRRVVYLHLSPRAREKAGWPDLTFVVDNGPHGHPIPWAIELKAKHGTLSTDQETMLAAMKLNGWSVAVVRSFDEFKQTVWPSERLTLRQAERPTNLPAMLATCSTTGSSIR
jgi:hypothetical protein